jgi:hypothetical protein
MAAVGVVLERDPGVDLERRFFLVADCVPMRTHRFFINPGRSGFAALIEPSFIGTFLNH